MEGTTGARKRQRIASAATAYIPDDVIRDILLRLPSRSVLRFRAVCKAWLRIASDPKFALEHHRRQPSLPLVSFLRGGAVDGKGVDAVDFCVEALDLRTDDFRSVVRFTDTNERCGRFGIHGSCDGLLLLSFDDRLYVCNPATHQWTRLPTPLNSSRFAGFYRHDHTGEYRALFYRGSWPGSDYYILVADSRKGRGIGLPSEKDVYKFKEAPSGPPALHRGSLHWPPQQWENHYILVFNTVTEVFRGLLPPPVIRKHMSLLEMENNLTIFSCGEDVTMVELWLLQDYENQKWICKHRIELPAMKVSTYRFKEPWHVFFMSEEGIVLVNPQQKLLHYDINGDLRESFRCDGCHLKITLYTLKESLIRHRFFEMQNNVGDGEDEPPPFFWGL
ncbi:F-box protein At5g49610-like [Phragmites australis]|uniref:F-box protein At5g49610-like n=1 Tax=Phragmites australis TaxID=29695 RepID=UPI002D7813E8|nr:F-box protein At5g49610-like [Phragmites australis]